MARPRKSTAYLKVHGGLRKERHGDPEPEAVGQLTKPAKMTAQASWFWDQHIEQVKANGAGGGDLATFISACEWWSIYRSMQAEALKPKGDYRAFIKMSMAWKNLNTALSRLGLSPTERAKLRLQPKPKEDKLTRLLKRKNG